jgi:hypothetical protein
MDKNLRARVAPTLGSNTPGNLFVAGEQVVLFTDDTDPFAYEVVDYFGDVVAQGHAVQKVELGPLPPGWYRLRCSRESERREVFLGVVLDRHAAALPEDGKVCGDAAGAWLLKSHQWRPFARMIRRAGIPWVRERLRWSDVEQEPGTFRWGKYREVADALAAEGIRICQVWHDTPSWARRSAPDAHAPDDLRHAYRFAKAASAEFRGEIQAWEIWNEPDIHFWKDEGSRYAGLLRAATAGIREGNPNAMVLSGSLCSGAGAFADHLFRSGAMEDCHRFNWHLYKPPADYPEELRAYARLAAERAPPSAWMTEAGIRLPASDDRRLDWEGLREQCRFVPRSVVMAIVAGNERYFFFVLPSYLERENQFGALLSDLTPAPAFVALSAAANLLGQAEPSGRFEHDSAEAWIFETPHGRLLVAWADEQTELAVPVEGESAELLNLFGAARTIPAQHGKVRIPIGPEASYLLRPSRHLPTRVERSSPSPPPRSRSDSGRLAISAHAEAPFDKRLDAYRLTSAAAGERAIPFRVELCNLDETKAVLGRLTVEVPPEWRAEPGGFDFEIDPMGRQTYLLRLESGAPSLSEHCVQSIARSDTLPACTVLTAFVFDETAFHETQTMPLDLGDPIRWRATRGGPSEFAITRTGEDRLRFAAYPKKGRGEWWMEAEYRLNQPINVDGFDAVLCDLGSLREGIEQRVFLVLDEPGASSTMAAAIARTQASEARYTLRDMRRAGSQVVRVRLGVWSEDGSVDFEVGRFRLAKLAAS